MTAPTSLDNIFDPGQTPSHTSITGETGSGKSALPAQILQDENLIKSQSPKD